MAHHVTRITTLIGSAIVSATALSAPQPFDADLVAALAANPSFPLPEDEEVVLHYIANCAATQRLCQELPLNLNGDTRPGGAPIVDMIIGANGAGGQKRFYSGRSDGLFNPAENFGGEGPTSGLKLADLDNDGDLDMVETQRGEGALDTGTNIVYVNRNGTLRSLFDDEQSLDSTKNDRSSGVVIGDVNGDTKLDVVISNETTGGHDVAAANQTNYLYLNTTTAANNVTFGPAIRLDAVGSEMYTRRMLLIDVEGDSDLDLVATAATTSANGAGIGNLLYINTGGTPDPLDNPFAAAIQLAASTVDNTDVANAIAAGDIDGDLDPDLVFSTWSDASGEARNRYYINNSTPGSINFETTGTFGTADNHTNVRLADFDNDGDRDLITTVFEGGNVLHRNVGAPTYFDAGFGLLDPFNVADASRAVDFADLNGDGSQDVVIANRGLLSLRYLNNDQCASGSCLGGLNGPFDNFGPTIVSQNSSAVVAPGGAPISINQDLLSNLDVNDTDNVYPTDFRAFPEPNATEYTCTDGVTGGACTTSRITPAPGAGAVITVFLRVSDSESWSGRFDTFDLTVGTGSAPTFTTSATLPPAAEDAAYTTTITASDNDGNVPLEFEAVGALPTWLELVAAVPATGTTATLRSKALTPPVQGNVGNHSIAIRVTDSGGLSMTQTFTLAVTNVNDKPSVTTTTLPNGTQGQVYSTTVTASDEDGTTPTFATPNTSLPTGLTLDAAGLISGTPTVSGTFQVVLTATDGTLPSDPVTVPLTIAAPGNASPVLTAPGAQTATVGTAFSLTVTATDADSDPLTFAATGLPTGLTMSPAGVITGTATAITGSPFTVTVTVNDGRGGTDSETFQLTVQAPAPGNGAPVLTAPGPQSATVGTAFNLTVAATDADSDPLTFAATGLPAGFAMSAAGVITGTATATTGSPFTVTVTVNDGRGGTDSETFQLTVQPPGNRAPVFTAPGPQSGTVGVAFNLSLAGSATDADGDPVTFAATGLPSGITLSPAGLLSGSPTTATGSPFAVTVTVTDGRGGTTSGTVQFTVSNPTSGGGGGSSGGGGSFGFLEVLGLLGMGALAARRRRAVSRMPLR